MCRRNVGRSGGGARTTFIPQKFDERSGSAEDRQGLGARSEMKLVICERRCSSMASPERIFAMLSDAPSWPSWFTLAKKVAWEPGSEPPVRLVTLGLGVTVREVVIEETPCSHHAYSIRSVIPVRNHRADVWLSARADGGTDIRWVAHFAPKVPGTGALLRVGVSKGLEMLCSCLVTAAETARQ